MGDVVSQDAPARKHTRDLARTATGLAVMASLRELSAAQVVQSIFEEESNDVDKGLDPRGIRYAGLRASSKRSR